MNTLKTVLNSIPDFTQLGSKSGVYLSFDPAQGWSTVRFNGLLGWIRSIFRSLGFYASTHLKVIQAQLVQESNVPRALLDRMGISWKKAHPVKTERLFTAGNITLWKGDITKVPLQAIVNAANEACLGGSGVDGAIHTAAGSKLLDECLKLPCVKKNVRCKTGEAVITGAGDLVGIQYVIHAVGPQGKIKEQLKSAYTNSLELAKKNGIRTIAFPSISTGIFGYDHTEATPEAIQVVQEFLKKYPGSFDEVAFIFSEQQKYDFARRQFN